MDSNHLLVPIKMQALVIDDLVIDKSGVIEIATRKFAANDGRWSPQLQDYQPLTNVLSTPGPRPFYGATRTYQGNPAEQLVLEKNSPALPQKKDRGVYLHWVLPAGLRHAYTPGLFDFPALPDHWLIVRFSHQDSAVKTRAWFVDGGAIVSETGQGNLLFEGPEKYVAKRAGKVVPFEEFATTNFSGARTQITALGNSTTGSPTFTAFIAENRNIFSWHDKLEDLRTRNAEGTIPEGTALTYLLIGWYGDPKDEPLSASVAKVIEQKQGWLIDPLGWLVETNPGDLLKRRSVFHGMVAHINYWSANTYKGQMLGYPGSPPVPGVMRKPPPTFTVGVGNNAEDALVSLVSSSYSGEQEGSILAKEQPNLWKALEAVIYRQTDSLVRSWNVAPRDITVHQNWFATRDAGRIWSILPKADNESEFPKDAEKTARQTKIRPSDEQLAKLKELNSIQAEVDATSRELAALQQDLYARWWKLCAKSKAPFSSSQEAEKDCRDLVKDVSAVRTLLNTQLQQLQPLPEQLRKTLPPELELKYDAAPRFWLPADPVIVVKNCGCPTKHRFPRKLPCRLPDQIASHGEVVVKKERKSFAAPSGVAEIATAAQKLPSCPAVLTALLNEGSIVEQAIADLTSRTLPEAKRFDDADSWRGWTQQLDHDLTWDGDQKKFPHDEVNFGKPGALNIRAHRLVDLWEEQPWSPLFLDWQVTWFPTTQSTTAENPFGPTWTFGEADFAPLNRESIPQKGYTVRGRSLLSPIDERIFKEPIDTLRELLDDTRQQDQNSPFTPAVKEVLSRYEIVWDKTLKELSNAGLMGQALSGFHQSLLRRDALLPRINPDSTRPWIANASLKTLEDDVRKAFEAHDDGLIGERLAPPAAVTATSTAPLFSMLRAGALRIDELWLIDDFGQSADLLGLTAARSRNTGQVFHPRMRWHNDQSVVAMPPRVLQPIRLNFRFTPDPEDKNLKQGDPALQPICGWLFFNRLDQALVLCDRHGDLMGHLKITKDDRGRCVSWDASAGGVALDKITNPSLQTFAKSFIQTTPIENPKLLELLNLIDTTLERIRPAAARHNTVLVGRPLALVNASVGLELFGKAWTDPNERVVARQGTGNPALDTLRVRVNLGDLHNTEDGLIGYYKAGAYDRVVVPQLSDSIKASKYIADTKSDAVQVGFGAQERITMLMDPWGSVQAACGLVPAKTISLAHAELDQTVTRLETSFRVGPVLLQGDKIALPTPTGDKGVWNFSGPATNQAATTVVSLDPKFFGDQPVVATEGRLLLLNEE
ncbi:MAG TPA: hypothetical protein VJR02_00305 [Pyrinomonadaceae bacterium]|nr:hypothetical protein [Pyrinomonadaceae bacterium]